LVSVRSRVPIWVGTTLYALTTRDGDFGARPPHRT
jgi:hypothetical protein